MKQAKLIIGGLVALFSVVFFHPAFALDMTGSGYQQGEHRTIQYAKLGTVVSARAVRINVDASTNTRASGAAVGAMLAGYAGSRNSNGAGLLLAALGGLAGDQLAQRMASEVRDSVELTVSLDNGQTVVVVQELDASYRFARGDRVRLIEGREARISPL